MYKKNVVNKYWYKMFLSEIKKKYVYLVENLLEMFFLFKILKVIWNDFCVIIVLMEDE